MPRTSPQPTRQPSHWRDDRPPEERVSAFLTEVFTALAHAAARYKLELFLLAVLGLLYLWAQPLGALAVLLTITIAIVLPPVRRALWHSLRTQSLKRRWERVDPTHSRVTKIRRVAAGDLVHLKIGPDATVDDLRAKEKHLATRLDTRTYAVEAIKITPDREHAQRATALIKRRDPFNTPPVPWPLKDAVTLNMWDRIPVGIDIHGDTVTECLIGKNILIGGEPESGKSAAQAIWIATAALDPNTNLWIMDGKQLDTAVWAPCAHRIVGPNGKDAIAMLEELHQEMEIRRRELLALGAEKIDRSMNLKLHFVVVDELAAFLRLPDPKLVNELLRMLLDLISRGRAVGIIICAATQRPGSDLHPQFTALRDLFAFRHAFRCKSWEMSDMVLGTGSSKAGYNAANILVAQRGVGILHADGYQPVRMKGFFLTREDLRAIAASAAIVSVPNDASSLATLEQRTGEPRLLAEEARALTNRRAILDALPERGEGLTRSEVQSAVGRPDRELHPVLRDLMVAELVYRRGGGRKGDPFRYLRSGPPGQAADEPRT